MNGFVEDTSPAYEAPMSKADFFRWASGREGRYELKGRRAVMQAGSTKRHGWICANFITALSSRVVQAGYVVGTADVAVEIGGDIRYPDVVVERLADDGTALSTERPVLLIEVLSPTSVGTDMTAKLAEYTSLPSLECYIVASQDEPICWVWQRDSASRAFPARPEEIKGRDASILIQNFAVSLPLAELYRGIGS